MRGLAGLTAAAAFIVAAMTWSAWSTGADQGSVPADTIALGREVYAEHCAACHGANLEGQPDWKVRLPSGRLPAPPHDASGHTWHHPDAVLFRIVEEGTSAVVGDRYESDMPAFGGILSDAEIEAVLAYLKSTWPVRERQFQEQVSEAERSQ